jgi:cell division protein FtsB
VISPGYRSKSGYIRQKEIIKPEGSRLRLNKSRFPTILLFILLLYFIFSFGLQFNQLRVMQKELYGMRVQVETLQKKNTELKDQLKLIRTDAYIEQVAREKLGLVKSGEVRVIQAKPE